jgi:hypothetical protein
VHIDLAVRENETARAANGFVGVGEFQVGRDLLAFWAEEVGGEVLLPRSRGLSFHGRSSHLLRFQRTFESIGASFRDDFWGSAQVVFAVIIAKKERRIQLGGCRALKKEGHL